MIQVYIFPYEGIKFAALVYQSRSLTNKPTMLSNVDVKIKTNCHSIQETPITNSFNFQSRYVIIKLHLALLTFNTNEKYYFQRFHKRNSMSKYFIKKR